MTLHLSSRACDRTALHRGESRVIVTAGAGSRRRTLADSQARSRQPGARHPVHGHLGPCPAGGISVGCHPCYRDHCSRRVGLLRGAIWNRGTAGSAQWENNNGRWVWAIVRARRPMRCGSPCDRSRIGVDQPRRGSSRANPGGRRIPRGYVIAANRGGRWRSWRPRTRHSPRRHGRSPQTSANNLGRKVPDPSVETAVACGSCRQHQSWRV